MKLHHVLGAVLLAVATSFATSAFAQELSREVDFDIPEQALPAAVIAFSEQSGIQVVTAGEDVSQLRASEVRGKLQIAHALRQLLSRTQLSFKSIGQSTIALISAKKEGARTDSAHSEAPSDALRLAQTDTATTPAQSPDDPSAVRRAIEEVIVTGKIDFVENDAFGATKMGMAIVDTPQTITVITSDMMEIMNLRNLDDVNRVMPGSSRTYDFVSNENFYFRGFQSDQNAALRVDGFRFQSGAKLNPQLYDRIEVIQGATSTVYGQNNPAGTVNVVSKLPGKEFALRLRADAGSNEYYNGGMELTGPLGNSNWVYHLLAGMEEYGTQYDDAYDDKVTAVAALQYQDDVKRFLVRLSHQDRDAAMMRSSYFQLDRPLPAGMSVANALAGGLVELTPLRDVPRSLYIGMPWSHQYHTINMLSTQFDYKFENGWMARAHYMNVDSPNGFHQFSAFGPFSVDGVPSREQLLQSNSEDTSNGVEVNLFGPFSALGREHTLFFGFDYSSRHLSNPNRAGNYGANHTGRFNIYAPDYSAYSLNDFETLAGASSTFRIGFDQTVISSGGTAQVVLNPLERLSVALGARYSFDTVRTRSVTANNVTETEIATLLAATQPSHLQHTNIVGQIGVTYRIFDKVNLYASYGETFIPTAAREWVDGLPNGRAIESQDGENTEIGVKAEIAAWSARLTAFDTQRTNIIQPDLAHPGFSLPVGNQTGRGIEGALQGQMMPRLNIFAGITYLDAEYKKGELEGLQPQNAPDLSVSLFSTYEFERILPGFGVGIGVTHKRGLHAPDTSYRDPAGGVYTVDLGDITEVDARLFYTRSNWDVSLSASNLSDEEYVTLSNVDMDSNNHINPGRELRLGVKYVFGAGGQR